MVAERFAAGFVVAVQNKRKPYIKILCKQIFLNKKMIEDGLACEVVDLYSEYFLGDSNLFLCGKCPKRGPSSYVGIKHNQHIYTLLKYFRFF